MANFCLRARIKRRVARGHRHELSAVGAYIYVLYTICLGECYILLLLTILIHPRQRYFEL